MMWLSISLSIFRFICTISLEAKALEVPKAEKSAHFWNALGEVELRRALAKENLRSNKAKNVILFLGDGMSTATITAGRILKGQMAGSPGEETVLSMDSFPHSGMAKTYAVDRQVSDSAATATAYLGGVKTNDGMLGLTGEADFGRCEGSIEEEKRVSSFLIDAQRAGKSIGIVTTTKITHATPGAAYAHTASRFWQNDADMTAEARRYGCVDIARQFIDSSNLFTVVLGGGRSNFEANTTNDVEYPTKQQARQDERDLIDDWRRKQADRGLVARYVWNHTEFSAVDIPTTDSLLGLFEPSHMHYEVERGKDGAGEPSLAEMTETAVRMLQKNHDNGFALLVEGGRIDHAHHDGSAFKALHELVAFDDAIDAAGRLTSRDDTLTVVTADHSHTLTMGSYSHRGNPIFGLAPSQDKPGMADDDKPYTTLLYANGPGATRPDSHSNFTADETCDAARQNLSDVDTNDAEYKQQATVPFGWESHGGEDVVVMAKGPMAHLFTGVNEQSHIAHVIRYATCVGKYERRCELTATTRPPVHFIGFRLRPAEAQVALNALLACAIVLLIALAATAATLAFVGCRAPKPHAGVKYTASDSVSATELGESKIANA